MPENMPQQQTVQAPTQPAPSAQQQTTAPAPRQPQIPKGKSFFAKILDQILGRKEKAPPPSVNVNVATQPTASPPASPPNNQLT